MRSRTLARTLLATALTLSGSGGARADALLGQGATPGSAPADAPLAEAGSTANLSAFSGMPGAEMSAPPAGAASSWKDALIPYLGAVLYPVARIILRYEQRSKLRPLNRRERATVRRALVGRGRAPGLSERVIRHLQDRIRIGYRAPMRVPWVEAQKLKRYCASIGERSWVQRGLDGIKAATRGVLDVSLCQLVEYAEYYGLIDQLPKLKGANAQTLGAEIYVGAAANRGLDQRGTLIHEAWHVRQWWMASEHKDLAWLRRLVGVRGMRTEVGRDMAMGFLYFKAHVLANKQYKNWLERNAAEEAEIRNRDTMRGAAGRAD